MKKNQSHKKIFHTFLVACGLFSLMQSTPVHAYSFQDFKTALQQTYPTLDTPLKDLKVFWSYGLKKLKFQKISKKESAAFWLAVKRTGIPLAVILGIISGGIYYKYRKKTAPDQPAPAQLHSDELIKEAGRGYYPLDLNKINTLIEKGIGILHKNKEGLSPLWELINLRDSKKPTQYDDYIKTIDTLLTKAKQYLTKEQFYNYINPKSRSDFYLGKSKREIVEYTPLSLQLGIFIFPPNSQKLKMAEVLLRHEADPNIKNNEYISIWVPREQDRYSDRSGVFPARALDKYLQRVGPGISDEEYLERKPVIKLLLRYGAKPLYPPHPDMQPIYEEALEEVKKERFLAALGHALREETPQEREPEALQQLPLEMQYHIFEYVIGRPVRPLPTEETEAGDKIEVPEEMEAPE